MGKSTILINGMFLTQPLTGLQRYATEVCLALSRLRSQHRLLVVAPKGRLLRTVPNVVQDTFPLTGIAWEQIRLPWLAKKFKASLLFCACHRAPIFRSKVPLVTTIHDAAVFAGPEWYRNSFQICYRNLLLRIGRISNIVVTCSNFSMRELVKYGIANKEKVRIIYEGANHISPNSISNERVNDIHLNKSGIEGHQYVLFIGSNNPRKNLKRLVAAWKIIPNEVKQGRLLAVSGMKFKGIYSNEGLSEVPNDVVFLGYAPDEQLSALYSHANAFVFPSLYEGFGLAPLEAMACGTPVLVSHSAPLPEVCGNAALYCDPYDTNDIATKLILVLTNGSAREDLCLKGLERTRIFTWENTAKQLMTVFEEVIDL